MYITNKTFKIFFMHSKIFSFLLTLLVVYLYSFIYENTQETLEVSRGLLTTIGTGTLGIIGFVVTGISIFASKKELNIEPESLLKISDSLTTATYAMICNVMVIFIIYIVTYMPVPMNKVIFYLSLSLISYLFFYSLLEITKFVKISFEVALNLKKLIETELKRAEKENKFTYCNRSKQGDR